MLKSRVNAIEDRIPDSVIMGNQLFEAVIAKNKTLVQVMVENGADVNLVDSRGMTPLMHSAKIHDPWISRFLVNNGADSSIKDLYGRTALDVAKEAKNWRVALCLSSLTPVSDDLRAEFDNLLQKEKMTRSRANYQSEIPGM